MKEYKNIFKISLLIPLAVISITGCQSEGEVIERPEKIYYDQAQRRMLTGNYIGAIEALETIESRYPFGKYAEQAQVELIYAHDKNKVCMKYIKLSQIHDKPKIPVYHSSCHFVLDLCLYIVNATKFIIVIYFCLPQKYLFLFSSFQDSKLMNPIQELQFSYFHLFTISDNIIHFFYKTSNYNYFQSED